MAKTGEKQAPTNSSIAQNLLLAGIGLTALTCTLAVIAWGQDVNWHLAGLSVYQIFPVLGLLAFSIMWSQYVMEAIKNYLGLETALGAYFTRTSIIVLLLILLHPGLLIAQRFHDGYGLPPGSYQTYVAPSEEWVVLLGTVSLLMFLAFELKRWLGKKPWWKYIIMLNDIAIVAIFYHGLRLGQDTNHDWFQSIWYAYGVVLIGVLAYKYYYTLRVKKTASAL
jgi:hypothetical protein